MALEVKREVEQDVKREIKPDSTSGGTAATKPIGDLRSLAQRVLGPDSGTTLLENCTKRPAKTITKGAKPKKKRNPNRVKKAPSAFLLFSQAMRPILKEQIPNITFADMGRLLGQVWNATSPQERIPFQRKDPPLEPAAADLKLESAQPESDITAAAIVNERAGGSPVPDIFAKTEDVFVLAEKNPCFQLPSVDLNHVLHKPLNSGLSLIDDLEDQRSFLRSPSLEFFEGHDDSVFFDL